MIPLYVKNTCICSNYQIKTIIPHCTCWVSGGTEGRGEASRRATYTPCTSYKVHTGSSGYHSTCSNGVERVRGRGRSRGERERALTVTELRALREMRESDESATVRRLVYICKKVCLFESLYIQHLTRTLDYYTACRISTPHDGLLDFLTATTSASN